ncbi:hypothetical protein L208DRAFT_225106 [Tricholoma matsutake]|nr:hypothetical protein L208DRAFT_225106 [Tricholoma matsutake 945]
MLSTLQHITKIAQDLSQPHFLQTLNDHSGSSLHALINSAFNNLLSCVNIINAQSPVSRLPVDVLSLLFQEVSNNESRTSRQPLSRAPLKINPAPRFQSPVLLSHVSRSWYDAAINSPLLWTNIDIFLSWNLPRIKMFLARSKPCPIFLNIIAELPQAPENDSNDSHMDPVYYYDPTYGIIELCQVVVPHISRCRSIFIRTDEHFASLFDTLHIQLCNLAAPLLERFFLQIPDIFLEAHLEPIFTLGAPMLSYVHLSQPDILCQRLPFHNLSVLHLEAEDIDFSQWLTVVSQCPRLETLAIYGRLKVETEMEPLLLPHLRSLELYGEMNVVADVLLVVSAPILECLVIAPYDITDLGPLEENSCHQRFAHLKSVTLAPFRHSIKISLQLASEYFPSVVDVSLIGRDPLTLIDTLANLDDDGNIIFPNMRSLALRNLPSTIETDLCNMVAFRYSKDRPLHTLYLDNKSMRHMSGLQLKETIELVELDKWAILRQGSVFSDKEDELFYPW